MKDDTLAWGEGADQLGKAASESIGPVRHSEDTAFVTICDEHGERLPGCIQCRRRTSWTAVELLAHEFEDPRFAVDGLIPEGLTFVAGAPKLGKSWMALGLGIAVASGGRALGSVPVEQGDVLYLALEDSPRRLKDRLRQVLDGSGAPDGLHLQTSWPTIDEGGAERLQRWLEAHPSTRLILVDVWPRIRPRVKASGDYFSADYDAAAELQKVAIEAGVAITVLYHTRKVEHEDFVATLTGTLGTAAAADTLMVVKRSRGQADATLHVTGRDVLEQELALRFDAPAGTWSLLGDAAEYTIGESRRVILEAVREHGSLTPKQASGVTDLSHELVKKTMQRMHKDGELKANRGIYSLPPVPGVPMSLDDIESGDKGTRGTPPMDGVSDA